MGEGNDVTGRLKSTCLDKTVWFDVQYGLDKASLVIVSLCEISVSGLGLKKAGETCMDMYETLCQHLYSCRVMILECSICNCDLSWL